jgi:hypothetical protein
MCRAFPAPSPFSTLESEYTPQRVSEGSMSEIEKSKEVGKTALFISKSHV